MLRYALFMSENVLVQMYNETIMGNDTFRELEYIYICNVKWKNYFFCF